MANALIFLWGGHLVRPKSKTGDGVRGTYIFQLSCLVPQPVILTLHILDIRLKIGHGSAASLDLMPPNAK